jgi:hypothetical protein
MTFSLPIVDKFYRDVFEQHEYYYFISPLFITNESNRFDAGPTYCEEINKDVLGALACRGEEGQVAEASQ